MDAILDADFTEPEVRVSGVTWRAESLSADIEKGEAIRVKALNGLVATVEEVQEQKSTSAR
jgi:membrane protein implicated in regulation of membrane protease activity